MRHLQRALSAALFALVLTPAVAESPIHHVFVVVLENEDYATTFGPASKAPYLAIALPKQGVLLPNYYAVGHASLDNYIAMISGQPPAPQTSADCRTFTEFKATGAAAPNGVLPGDGCFYPPSVMTLANQLAAHGLTWRGYMEDMGNDPDREAATCAHPGIGGAGALRATPTDAYAYRHDPFVYFHSIVDDKADCDANVVPLTHLGADLSAEATTPNFLFIVPNVCNDGHDSPCRDGRPGGLVSANLWLKTWIPKILSSPAFTKDGLLVVTFDEAGSDSTACCNEPVGAMGQPPGAGGPGGGRVGAVMLSPFIAPGTTSAMPMDHYGLLRGIEDVFALPHLANAGAPGLATFAPLLTKAP